MSKSKPFESVTNLSAVDADTDVKLFCTALDDAAAPAPTNDAETTALDAKAEPDATASDAKAEPESTAPVI